MDIKRGILVREPTVPELLNDFAIAQFFAANNKKTRMFKKFLNIVSEIYTVLKVI